MGQHGQLDVDVSRNEIRTAGSFVALKEVRGVLPAAETRALHLVIRLVRRD